MRGRPRTNVVAQLPSCRAPAVATLHGQPSAQRFPVVSGSGTQSVGYLGIAYQDVTTESANALKLPEEVGVEVTILEPGSPAAAAGLRVDDVVVEYNGQRVEGQLQLSRLISETPPGRQVRIKIYRNGYVANLIAKIGSRPPSLGGEPRYSRWGRPVRARFPTSP